MTAYDVSIPAELRKLRTWMHSFGVNDEGEAIKRPRIAGTRYFGSKTTPAHWRTFGETLAAMRRFGGYPYLVVTRDDPYALIDFDDVRDPETGALSEWARGWLDRLDTFAEASTSGGGVRAAVRSEAHFKSSKAARDDGRAVEVYARDHGCIMTGRVLNDAPIRGDIDDVLHELRAEVAERHTPRRSKYRGKGGRIEDLPIETLSDWRETPRGVMAFVECPWSESHSSYSGPSEAAVGQIIDGDERGGMFFRCFHAHCEDKRWEDFRHVTIPRRVLLSGGRMLAGNVFGGAS